MIRSGQMTDSFPNHDSSHLHTKAPGVKTSGATSSLFNPSNIVRLYNETPSVLFPTNRGGSS